MSIVAYTYQAEVYCPNCIREAFSEFEVEDYYSAEGLLDVAAKAKGIDRMDEWTFDSDVFPKVVFGWQTEDQERCGKCNAIL